MNIKALTVLGSLVGFLIGTGFGMASSSPWPATLWRASVAALIVAILTRWWGRVWAHSLHDAMHTPRKHFMPAAGKPTSKP